jgi:hypothetical protein
MEGYNRSIVSSDMSRFDIPIYRTVITLHGEEVQYEWLGKKLGLISLERPRYTHSRSICRPGHHRQLFLSSFLLPRLPQIQCGKARCSNNTSFPSSYYLFSLIAFCCGGPDTLDLFLPDDWRVKVRPAALTRTIRSPLQYNRQHESQFSTRHSISLSKLVAKSRFSSEGNRTRHRPISDDFRFSDRHPHYKFASPVQHTRPTTSWLLRFIYLETSSIRRAITALPRGVVAERFNIRDWITLR